MNNCFLTALLVACGLLLTLARPALGQAPTYTEALSLNPNAATGTSAGWATATNAVGDQYVTGYFTGTIVLGTTTLVATNAFNDIFVAKCSGSTGAWLWAVRVGGTGEDRGWSVAVDASGNALVTGFFQTTVSFATSPTATSLTSAGGSNVFVAKFAAATGAATWAVQTGGLGGAGGLGIAVDAGGNALVTGFFLGTVSFATSPTATSLISAGYYDMFVAKFAAATGAAVWAVDAGGVGNEGGCSVAVDAGGNALVSGYFTDTANFATSPATSLTSAGDFDVFVAKFGANNGVAAWAVRAGGVSNDQGQGVAVDAGGNALVTGFFTDTANFSTSPTATSLTSAGFSDVFVAKFGATNGVAAWAVRAGGPGIDASQGIVLDRGGNALVTGYFQGTATFVTSPAATPLASAGGYDVFVAKFGAVTGAAAWAVRAGGPGGDFGYGVALDTGGNALVTGSFQGTASFGSLAVVGGNGPYTGFVAKLGAAAPSATTATATTSPLTLAPNPTRTATTLTLPAAAQARAVTVADALGRVLRRAALPAQATALALDVAGLAPGVYTVRCAAATARLLVE